MISEFMPNRIEVYTFQQVYTAHDGTGRVPVINKQQDMYHIVFNEFELTMNKWNFILYWEIINVRLENK